MSLLRPKSVYSPRWLLVAAVLLALPAAAFAQGPSTSAINSGDTGWVLTSAALVFLMTAPGLALFYGGLVRRKNVLSVLMQCMMIMFLISVQWILFGYSLAFGPDKHGLIGGLEWWGLEGVSAVSPSGYAATIPHQAFMIFQMMFAVITPALIIGAFAERMRFGPFCIFTLLWATLVYDPVCHWVWGAGGIFSALGVDFKINSSSAIDFAGGIVVHISAGAAALACAIFLGRRKGYPNKISPPHNLPFAVIGAGLLWFGWFGFNAGSALGAASDAGSQATSAFVVTHTAGAVGGLTWAVMDWLFIKRVTMLGAITGAVAGLATVTPASGFVNVGGAALIGVAAGVVPWLFVSLIKPRLGYDDSLDAFGVHGIGGLIGTLMVGFLAVISPINARGGGMGQFLAQLKASGVTIVYSFVLTLVLLKVVDVLFKLRACDHEETLGLDLSQHREAAYTVID